MLRERAKIWKMVETGSGSSEVMSFVGWWCSESDMCMRQCCGPSRGFVMHITNNFGQVSTLFHHTNVIIHVGGPLPMASARGAAALGHSLEAHNWWEWKISSLQRQINWFSWFKYLHSNVVHGVTAAELDWRYYSRCRQSYCRVEPKKRQKEVSVSWLQICKGVRNLAKHRPLHWCSCMFFCFSFVCLIRLRLRNDPYCVGWGVKLYTHSLTSDTSSVMSTTGGQELPNSVRVSTLRSDTVDIIVHVRWPTAWIWDLPFLPAADIHWLMLRFDFFVVCFSALQMRNMPNSFPGHSLADAPSPVGLSFFSKSLFSCIKGM